MKARTAIAGTAHRVRLTAVGWGLTTVLACIALSACTSSSSPPAVFTPAVTGSSSVSASSSSSASASPSPSSSASPSEPSTPSPTDTASPVPTITITQTVFPTVAPVTGGGGTAGFQNAGLAVLGGTAIAAGVASIAYRRRMTRKR